MQLENYIVNLAHLSWINAQNQTVTPEFFNASLFKVGNVEGFCGEKNGILYIGFQGTADYKDVLSDLKFNKISIDGKIKVHAGFYGQYKEIESFIIQKCNKYAKVVFSGQSLGGALAVLSVYEMTKFYGVTRNFGCVTFAAPKVGNSYFVKSLDEKIISIKQYVYKKDPVPYVPLWIMGYRYTTKNIKFGKINWWEYLLPFNPMRHLPINYINDFKI